MSKNKNLGNQRQAFLLTFFPDKSKTYEEKEVNGFILVKHIVNGDTNHFEVAIYPKDHLIKAKAHNIELSFNQQFSRALAKDD